MFVKCSVCHQNISKGKEQDFFGEKICANCHRRLRVGKYNESEIADSFIPIFAHEDDQNHVHELTMKMAHLAKRTSRDVSSQFLQLALERFSSSGESAITGFLLAGRAAALYGSTEKNPVTEVELKALLGTSMELAGLLEAGWKKEEGGSQRRFQAITAFLGNVQRGNPDSAPLCQRLMLLERARVEK